MTGLEQRDPVSTGQSHFFSEMSAHELDRFLVFVNRFTEETGETLGLAAQPRDLPVMVQLMRSHLRGRMETPSSLIDASGLARGTAHRLIEDMIGRGLIVKRPRTRSGKTFSLHPSPVMIGNWVNYLRRMKALLGTAFGIEDGADYFFGASYLSASSIAPMPVLSSKIALPGGLRLLLHADATFMAMQRVKRQFELHFGTELEVRALSIDRLHDEILLNAQRPQSRYDLVTCDLCWMEEMIQAGAVRQIEDLSGAEARDYMDFHPEALATARRGDALFGIPVQTTPELLIYRTDVFEARGLAPPRTLDEMLAVAAALHDPAGEMNGICWNGARGTPVGTTFMMLMADFGQPVLNLPALAVGFRNEGLRRENLTPMLETAAAHRAAEFLLELLPFSPPNVLQMSWFERARCFAQGQAAMGYCYTQILPMIEADARAPARGRIGYLPHPSAQGVPQLAPLGGWNICIPGNLKDGRLDAVRIAARTLTSAAATKLYIENGSLVSSRFSVCNDPAVAHGRPVIATVDKMARAGQLQSWPRPAVPQLNTLVRVLGEEIHNMLLRNKKPRAALRDAQARCEAAMELV